MRHFLRGTLQITSTESVFAEPHAVRTVRGKTFVTILLRVLVAYTIVMHENYPGLNTYST
jgi:hypothetical protein